MPRGRPVKSEIRQNLIEILFFLKKGYGYELHKHHNAIFTPCTNESIYYHLKKGVLLEEFKVHNIVAEKGDYSWGKTAEKTYYTLGPKAQPKMDNRVKEYFEKKNK